MLNVSSYGNIKADVYVLVPPPYYEDDDIVNKTVVNEIFPALIPKLAADCGVKEDHIVNLFELMGGKELTKYELFCSGQWCGYMKPNFVGMVYAASQVYKKMPKDTQRFIEMKEEAERNII